MKVLVSIVANGKDSVCMSKNTDCTSHHLQISW